MILFHSNILLLFCLVDFYFSFANGFLPAQNPRWTPTYDMKASTLSMLEHYDGLATGKQVSAFGIVSIDWSTDKSNWAKAKPMNSQQSMYKQAEIIKKISPTTKIFVYKNLVKALPWFDSVRKILEDPQYSGFFLKFDLSRQSKWHVRHCDIVNPSLCSLLYHDQEQTPQVPQPWLPHPDGVCDRVCDCGSVPCGEYAFDHRNGSMLTNWLLNEYLNDPAYVDGYFIDDYWNSFLNPGDRQRHHTQGPSEMNQYAVFDMGLSDQDVLDLTSAWQYNMEFVQRAIIERKQYTWSLMLGESDANASPVVITPKNCQKQMQLLCNNTLLEVAPLLFGLTHNNTALWETQIITFLTVRGPFAWIGWGEWGMVWPKHIDPPEWSKYNIGSPTAVCNQRSPHLFERYYSSAKVTIDCESFKGEIKRF